MKLQSKAPQASHATPPLAIATFVLAVLAFAGVAFLLWAKYSADNRIAYVKIGPLMEKYEGMTVAKTAYQKKAVVWQANVDTLAKELQASIREFERKQSQMSLKEIQLTRQLLTNKQQQLQQYEAATRKKMAEEDQKLTNEVATKVNKFLEAYGKEHGYLVILGANATGNILYGSDAVDLTDELTEKLNAEYKNQPK